MNANAYKMSILDNWETHAAPIRILYGTATGNSEILAKETAEKLNERGWATELSNTEDFTADELYHIETLLLLMSTDNDGDPPMMAEDFYESLDEKMESDLHHLSYSVLALGDSYYPNFCQAGKDFDEMLEKLGAKRMAERVDCDIQFWADFDKWLDNVLSVLMEKKKRLNFSV